MTRKAIRAPRITQADIRAIGRELTVKRNAWGEYRVTYALAAIMLTNESISRADAIERAEQCAYYTTDIDDAYGTARLMHKRYVELARI